jgi:hypothetical protein
VKLFRLEGMTGHAIQPLFAVEYNKSTAAALTVTDDFASTDIFGPRSRAALNVKRQYPSTSLKLSGLFGAALGITLRKPLPLVLFGKNNS